MRPNPPRTLKDPPPTGVGPLAAIIPTKDRPRELKNLLVNLEQQTLKPAQVIIIDSGRGSLDALAAEHRILNITYRKYSPPSSARQRNEGLNHLAQAVNYVAFFDDDIILDLKAIENTVAFLDQASTEVAAVCLNLTNHPRLEFPELKRIPLVERLGLYSWRKGVVLRSGFQTLIGPVREPTEVAWFPSTAIVCRRKALPLQSFDPWFQAYSYLEDLDFSYRLGKANRLLVIPSATFFHLESPHGREKRFLFGQKEVLNRVYFVRKHKELSLWLCGLGLILKSAMNLFQFLSTGRIAFLFRSIGNQVGFMRFAFRI